MYKEVNIVGYPYNINRAHREQLNGHKAVCLWFTGLSGSGKSTLANHVERQLFERGIRTFVLDGDDIRCGLNKGLSFSEADRDENLRRAGEVARLMCDAGIVTLAAFVSPYKHSRQMVREILGDSFNEVFVDTAMEVCEQRDVKGLYKKARNGKIHNFTGIDSPFEVPENSEIHIVTATQTLDMSVNFILDYILSKIELNN
jgi:adenylylsulfate kinase